MKLMLEKDIYMCESACLPRVNKRIAIKKSINAVKQHLLSLSPKINKKH